MALVAAVIVLSGGAYLTSKQGVPSPSFGLETSLLLAISTWLIARRLSKIKSPSTFAQAYLASVAMQLLLWVSYAGVMFYLDQSGAPANAVFFLVNCLVFIPLGVAFLYRRN